jgi:hypothetical protein
MTNRYAITNCTASAELAADQGDCRDKKVLQALVTAGALVGLTVTWKTSSATKWLPIGQFIPARSKQSSG